MKRLRFKGMTFTANNDGSYTVTAENGRYKEKVSTFGRATEWIWNMADNNDIARMFCHRICKAFNCDVYGRKNL